MGLVQLNAPGDFHAAIEKRWDLRDPDGLEPVDVDVIVSRTPADFYRIAPTVTVSVNADGATVRRRSCSSDDFQCNFSEGDAILVARDVNPVADPIDAPIRLRFDPGVRAVGAWLGACTRDPFDTSLVDGQPLFGALWVALKSDPDTWRLVTAEGWTGDVCRVGTALTAPFVAARATAGDRIVEARFDVALLGNRRYDKIAVSELTVEV